ncbi:MAG: nucleotidyltransferase domain-containing protein [Alkaliphilus sp.]|nr:nucleotidyltransferase domain-containing protein [Alkaliphilus sp.]
MVSNVVSIETIKKKIIPILRKYPVYKAVLFGSYAQGKVTEKSDIDLYIDTNGKLKGLDFVGLLEILVDALGVNIDLIDKSHVESDSLIIRKIEDGGIIIYEKSEDYSKNN